jgi:hypothetical protein
MTPKGRGNTPALHLARGTSLPAFADELTTC